MRRTSLSILLILSSSAFAQDTSLQGVWQISSAAYDGEIVDLPEPPQIKIFTAERVMYTYYSPLSDDQPAYLSVGHGTYDYKAGSLTETIENHSNPDLIGETFEVEVSISADGGTFTQVVDLGKYVLRETWTRVE